MYVMIPAIFPVKKCVTSSIVPKGYDQLRGETALPGWLTLKKRICENHQRHRNMGHGASSREF
jgi:hypothetical protein